MTLEPEILASLRKLRAAAHELALSPAERKDRALGEIAAALRKIMLGDFPWAGLRVLALAWLLLWSVGCGFQDPWQVRGLSQQEVQAWDRALHTVQTPGGSDAIVRFCESQEEAGAVDRQLIARGIASCPVYWLASWRDAGFTPENLGEWSSQFSSASEAATWRKAGFPAADAGAWHSDGFGPADAFVWRKAGFTPEDADAYAHHYGISSPDDAESLRKSGVTAKQAADPLFPRRPALQEWVATDFSPEEVQKCTDAGITRANAVSWKKAGFSCFGAQFWIKAGATSPADAIYWKARGLAADTYYLRSHNLSAQTVRHWQEAGVDVTDPARVEMVEQYMQHGASLTDAVYYLQHNVPVQEMRAVQRHKSLVERLCHGRTDAPTGLFLSSPYATEGHCYDIWGVIYQWLGPTRGLAQVFGGRSALVEFDSPPPAVTFQGLAIGKGAYTYEDISGAATTVPVLRLVH